MALLAPGLPPTLGQCVCAWPGIRGRRLGTLSAEDNGIPGRVYRTMENVVYANLPNLKRQVEMYEAIPPGTPKPENIVRGFPVFHHSSKSRCIAVVTLSSHPQTESLLPLVNNQELCRDLRNSAEAWYQSMLTKYGNVSSMAFWQ